MGTFVGIVLGWIVAMLAWLVFVIYASLRGTFLKHSAKLSNLVGVAAVVTFTTAIFGLLPTAIVFQFPMVLAPNFTVPLFMISHLFALVKMLDYP